MSVNELGDQYVLLGPYFEMKARQEIEEEDFPFHHPLGQAVDRYGSFFLAGALLEKQGRWNRWLLASPSPKFPTLQFSDIL